MGKLTSSIWDFVSKYKYPITIITGTLLVGVVGDNSFLHMAELHFEIKDLNDEIESYNKLYEDNLQQLRDLERDPRNISRVAREKYFMKTDDEDIFVLRSSKYQDGKE